MKRKQLLFLIVSGLILFSQISCGRKGPPFVPKEGVRLRVAQLKGEWKEGEVVLKGRVAVPRGGEKELSRITGCRVYYARYSADNPPCETCPVKYKSFTEIKGEVIRGGRFSCRIGKQRRKGLHFFEVRLIGKSGTPGPSSNRVKLTIYN